MKRFVKCFFCFIDALPILSDRNIHLFVLYFILTIFKVGVNVKTKVMRSILLLFLLCSIVEYFEFLLIRTDQTFLAENVLCKLFILLLIFLVLQPLLILVFLLFYLIILLVFRLLSLYQLHHTLQQMQILLLMQK